MQSYVHICKHAIRHIIESHKLCQITYRSNATFQLPRQLIDKYGSFSCTKNILSERLQGMDGTLN